MSKYIDFEKLKQKIPLLDVVQQYGHGHELKRQESTGAHVGDCPLCGESDPKSSKFKVDPNLGTNGGFHCFGCGASGNAIEYVAQLDGIKETEAARRIATHFSVTDCAYQKPRRSNSKVQQTSDAADSVAPAGAQESDETVDEDRELSTDNGEVSTSNKPPGHDMSLVEEVLRERIEDLQNQLNVKDGQIASLQKILINCTADA